MGPVSTNATATGFSIGRLPVSSSSGTVITYTFCRCGEEQPAHRVYLCPLQFLRGFFANEDVFTVTKK